MSRLGSYWGIWAIVFKGFGVDELMVVVLCASLRKTRQKRFRVQGLGMGIFTHRDPKKFRVYGLGFSTFSRKNLKV